MSDFLFKKSSSCMHALFCRLKDKQNVQRKARSYLHLNSRNRVVLVNPVPRSNSDYIFTFEDGVCRASSCNSFCGDAETNSITEFPVESPIPIQWMTNVIHEPFEYRISLSKGGDEGFDTNILAIVSNTAAHNEPTAVPKTGSFTTNITIPESYLAVCSAASSSTCTLQLFDLYYFVSCANVVVVLSTTNAQNNTAEDLTVTSSAFILRSGRLLLAAGYVFITALAAFN